MATQKKGLSIGYVLSSRTTTDLDRMIIRGLKKKGLEVLDISLEDGFDLERLDAKTKDCKVVFNYTTYEPITFDSIELSKTLEELGKRVINSSHSFFYEEEKWMFYLKSLEAGIRTPQTYLVTREQKGRRVVEGLLSKSPLVLKAIFSDEGREVEIARTYREYVKKLRKIRAENPQSPIIAQEYVPNPEHKTYRATLINFKVRQFVEKINKKSWKQIGCGREVYRSLRIPKGLKQVCERAARAYGMEFCGLDLMVYKGKWYVIEANSSPTLCFVNRDAPRMVKHLVDFLYGECKRLG